MSLFLLQFAIEYKGHSQEELLSVWKEHSSTLLKDVEGGRIKQLWKVAAERKVYMVVEMSAEEVDKLLFTLPLMRKLGDQVQVQVTPLIPYEKFASFIKSEVTGKKEERSVMPVVPKDGNFYWLQFDVEYPGKSQRELFDIWCEEAAAALSAKSAGRVVDLWKSVGKRQIHAILCTSTADELDKILFVLPIMKKHGEHVQASCKVIRPYKKFFDDLCSLAK